MLRNNQNLWGSEFPLNVKQTNDFFFHAKMILNYMHG